MSALDKIRRGKRLTADFLYELLYGIANGDLATQNNNLPYWRNKTFYDHVIEGCVWTGDNYGVNRNASMSAGLVMINGKVVSVDAVANRAFTASKDTYHYIDENGASTFSEVSNNAASPTAVSNAILCGIIVTGASSIANLYSINQGQLANNTGTVRLPASGIANGSTVTDGNGKLIYPRANRNLVAGVTRNGNATTGSPGGSSVAWNGMSWICFEAEADTNYELVIHEPALSGATGNDNLKFILYLSTAANTYTSLVNESNYYKVSGNAGVDLTIPFWTGTYSGKTFLNIKFANTGFTGTMTMNSDGSRGAIYTIKRT